MGNKLVIMLLLTVPAVADPAWFDKIHQKDLIAIVTPDGYCEAKVVSRGPDQITVRLKSTTSVCGARKSLVQVARRDVQDVVDDRRLKARSGEKSEAAKCAALVIGIPLITVGRVVGELNRSAPPLLAVIAGSGIAAAIFCRDRSARYGVFIDRIVAVQP